MGLSRTVSDRRRFPWKIAKFSNPVFCAAAEGVSLGIGYRCMGQKHIYGATRTNKKFDDIFSRLDTINQRDRQTDCLATAKTALTHIVAR